MTTSTPPTATPTRPFELRAATSRDDLPRFLVPVARAFGQEIDEPEWQSDINTLEPERVFAAFEGDEAVGAAGALTFRLTVPGGAVAAAGVTVVGVSPSHRRKGILRSMMRHQLDDVHERGEPVAILWASEGAIYQRFGYGLATLSATLNMAQVRSSYRRPVEARGRVRLVSDDEALATFPAIYEQTRPTIPGAISRSAELWRWQVLFESDQARRKGGPKFRALLEIDGAPAAYAIYRLSNDWDTDGPKGEVSVLDVAATTPAAERELWRWLLDIDLVERIRGWRQPVAHPLLLMLAEPRRLGLLVGDGLWLRIVDLAAALGARTYAAEGKLDLGVEDEFCPWNMGRWRLTVRSGGSGTIERTDAEPDLVLDTNDIASAYLGAFRFADLARAGRVVERRPGAIARADSMFATAHVPWCATMF
jgi:predicted acetyltransferase